MNLHALTLVISGFALGLYTSDMIRWLARRRERRRREQEGREILEECEQLISAMMSGVPIYGTEITRTETPDGPLHTFKPMKLQLEADDNENSFSPEVLDD